MAYANPEHKKAANKRFYELTREKQLAQAKALYAKRRPQKIAQNAAWRKTLSPERKRAINHRDILWRDYRITPTEYGAMLAAQGGVCAICRQPPAQRRLAVDHDHKTDKIRGLLCMRCNPMLGYAKDSIATLLAGVEYLKRHTPDPT